MTPSVPKAAHMQLGKPTLKEVLSKTKNLKVSGHCRPFSHVDFIAGELAQMMRNNLFHRGF